MIEDDIQLEKRPRFLRRGDDALESQQLTFVFLSLQEPFEFTSAEGRCEFHMVALLDLIGRVRQFVGQVAIVCHNDQTRGVAVQPAGHKEFKPAVFARQQLEYQLFGVHIVI
ncbi:MAG: hypothetical protein BWY82_00677 [Verrucomicrobia bacterium ADurb.Bin474]|nr:MAG: hypothetical protein BWY82_00677 [Verrucomicrobia bacterium ADurb.Bin474]